MTIESGFELQRVSNFDDEALAAAVSEMYGEQRSSEWLHWKHREGPWGRSDGWAVCDDQGILGLAFELPWQWRVGDVLVPGTRLIDGGSIPRARGKGVFRLQVQAMLADFDPEENPAIATATATPEAAQSHVKLGATLLAPIDHAYGLPSLTHSAALQTDDDALGSLTVDARPGQIVTDWAPNAMRWRIDERSGHQYEAASLVNADVAAGAVFRVTKVRGARVAVLLFAWGPTPERRRVLSTVCRRKRCVAVLGTAVDHALDPAWRPIVRRGVTHLCVWDLAGGQAQATGVDPLTARGWALGLAEFEGVM